MGRDLAPGTVIGGVSIIGLAGRGGMGSVYRAQHLALDRTVAIKVMNADVADDPEFLARFRREARLAAALDHPHVVPIMHAGEEGGRVYLTMKFVDGTDLSKVIREGSVYPAEAVEIVHQVAGALDAAHARGLVHRDVKPANILVSGSIGRPHSYLTDFGITKEVSDDGLTAAGMTIGTVDYMSPEQINGDPVDGRSDQYALACVLFQLLTGRVPFAADRQVARISGHLYSPPPDLRTIRPQLPGELAHVVAKGLAKQPDRRFASCTALAEAARTALVDGGSVHSTVPFVGADVTHGPGGSSTMSAPRAGGPSRRVLLGAGAGAAALAAGAIGWHLIPRDDESAGPGPSPGVVGELKSGAISVGPNPRGLAGGDGALWTANYDDGTVSRIDLANRTVRSIKVNGGPGSLHFGQGKTWVWNYSSSFTPVDAATGEVGELIRLDHAISRSAAGTDFLWYVVPSQHAIGRIDMRSGENIPGLIKVGSRPDGIAASGGKVYVVCVGDRALVTLDEATGQPAGERVDLPAGIVGVVAAFGRVFVGGNGLAQVRGSKVTAADLENNVRGSAALGNDGVWIHDGSGGTITKYDFDLKAPLGASIAGVPPRLVDFLVFSGSLWLLDGDNSQVHEIRIL